MSPAGLIWSKRYRLLVAKSLGSLAVPSIITKVHPLGTILANSPLIPFLNGPGLAEQIAGNGLQTIQTRTSARIGWTICRNLGRT
jgi:hypothetical protein